MIITHTQRKEGGQWKPYTGVCDWEKEEFTGLIDNSHAYKFDNGDIWDKVGGWRDPMGWSSDIIVPRIDGVDYNKLSSDLVKNAMKIRDPIFGFLDAGRQKVNHGVVAHYESPKPILWPDTSYSNYITLKTTGDKLCSRHLWQ